MEVPDDVESSLRNRAWRATVAGQYEKALRIYEDELPPVMARYVEQPPNRAPLSNIAILHMLRGDLDRALTLFKQVRDLPPPPAIPEPFVGCLLWMKGERLAACEDWSFEIKRRRSGLITHCDDAGGVEVPALLWWASAHEGMEGWRRTAEQELKRRWRTKMCQRSNWPGPLAPFLLSQGTADEMGEGQLMERIGETKYLNLNFERHCLAHFYCGAACLARGDVSSYRDHLERVQSALPADLLELRVSAPEFHLARSEYPVSG